MMNNSLNPQDLVDIRDVCVDKDLPKQERINEFVRQIKERMTPVKNAAAETELMEVNRELASRGHFLKSLYENMVAGLINAEEFTAMKTDYEGKIAALSKRADQIRTQRRERASEQDSYRDFTDAASDALSSKELTADTINCLVKRIQVQRDKSFEILLRFKDEFREVKRVG